MLRLLCCLFIAVFAAPEDCQVAYERELVSFVDLLFANSTDYASVLRLFYSGKDINDLGHYDACVQRSDSRYLILAYLFQGILVSIAFCVPKACDAASMSSLLQLDYSGLPLFVTEPDQRTIKAGGVFTLTLLGLLVLLAIIGTVLGDRGILESFSLKNNLKSLLANPVNDRSKLLNGVRVMSLGWVVLGHVYLFRLFFPIINIEMLQDIFSYDSTMFSYGGFYAVDAFFWMSGFLMSYLLISESHKKSRYPWGLVIVLRLVRLYPVYIAYILVSYTVVPYLGSGPKWSINYGIAGHCEEYWWSNLLFINNIYPRDQNIVCIGQAWYLANDMQFYLFGVLLLVVYRKFEATTTWLFVIIVVLFSTLYAWGMSDIKGYKIAAVAATDLDQNDLFFSLYANPICRCSTYLIGFLTGCVYFAYKSDSNQDKWSKAIARFVSQSSVVGAIMFLVGWGIFMGLLLIMRHCYKDVDNGYLGYSDAFNAFYGGTCRFFVGLSFTLMFLPILLGHLSFVRTILSLKLWSVLGKLTYCAYLFHVIVLSTGMGWEVYGYNYSALSIFLDFVYFIVITFVVSLIMHLLIEAPCNNLLRERFKRRKPETPGKLLAP